MSCEIIRFKKLHDDAIVPRYAHDGDAGVDLYTVEDCTLKPREKKVVPVGIAIEMSDNLEATVRPRSGFSIKGVPCYCNGQLINKDVKVILGTIDSNYRGEIGIIVQNFDTEIVTIPKGTKLAQIVFSPVLHAILIESDELESTDRGSDGYGSTNK